MEPTKCSLAGERGLLTLTLLDVASFQHKFTTSNNRNMGHQLIDILGGHWLRLRGKRRVGDQRIKDMKV